MGFEGEKRGKIRGKNAVFDSFDRTWGKNEWKTCEIFYELGEKLGILCAMN
jgi:hypothetical protein